MAENKTDTNDKLIARNKRAGFDYVLSDRFEAGMVLQGTEVKSLRDGRADLTDSYARFTGDDELFVHNLDIPAYSHGTYNNHEPKRPRKLLLHRQEVRKLKPKLQERGFTLIPTKLYFKRGYAKLEIALAVGKKKGDRREDMKKREHQKEIARYRQH
jgi:SsrA-binding protein